MPLNSETIESEYQDTDIDEDTSERGDPIQLPQYKEFQEKPQMARTAIVADMDIKAQQKHINGEESKAKP